MTEPATNDRNGPTEDDGDGDATKGTPGLITQKQVVRDQYHHYVIRHGTDVGFGVWLAAQDISHITDWVEHAQKGFAALGRILRRFPGVT